MTTLFILWSAANLVNKLFGYFIGTASRMHHSDQLLIERAFRVFTATVVVLVTLADIGVDMTVLAVFGGTAGFMIGVGLQEIGSNLVCGIALLMRKPISQGDLHIKSGLIPLPPDAGLRDGVLEPEPKA